MRAIPRIGITLGDSAGVGPELIVKAFSQGAPHPSAAYIIFGSGRVLEEEQKALGRSVSLKAYDPEAADLPPGLYLSDQGLPNVSPVKGRATADGGRASFHDFEKAVENAALKKLDAIVTAPISKQAWGLAGVPWRGHTEFLAQTYPEAIMAFWSGPLKVALLSHHVPLREALERVEAKTLEAFFLSLNRSLAAVWPRPFHLLAAGLNPHAGEGGLMGREEEEIEAAVRRASAAGVDIEGPFPPDTVFRRALGRRETMVAALYHDQGLIPFKLVAFESGVNVTLGLPFVRTSPDHGTAYDIAPRRIADPASMIQSIRLAVELAQTMLHLGA